MTINCNETKKQKKQFKWWCDWFNNVNKKDYIMKISKLHTYIKTYLNRFWKNTQLIINMAQQENNQQNQ